MSYCKPEQMDRHEKSSVKKWCKKQLSKWRRQQEKKDLENAPVRNSYAGYSG